MPSKDEFLALHSQPLFTWMAENSLGITWWLWGAVGIASLLSANTLLCSIESLVRKREARQWLLIISPQVIHLGVLLIILAHLFSSYGSFKGTAYVYKNSVLNLPNGLNLIFEEIKTDIGASGYIRDWSAVISYSDKGRVVSRDIIEPNNPSFRDGLGIYIKDVRGSPFPVALIEVSREPGALWALAGAILFIAGMIALLLLKIKREDEQGWIE